MSTLQRDRSHGIIALGIVVTHNRFHLLEFKKIGIGSAEWGPFSLEVLLYDRDVANKALHVNATRVSSSFMFTCVYSELLCGATQWGKDIESTLWQGYGTQKDPCYGDH